MDKLYFIFDEQGNFISQNYFSEKPEGGVCIEDNPITESFIKIKYDWQNLCYYEGATPEEIAEATKLVVPERVTAIQILSALALSGIYETQIETIIKNLAEPNRTIGLIALKRATVFERNNALIEIVRQQFNLTTQDVDNLFITASNIIL